jgi:TatA/E family protein of Tat protein translocase
MIGMPGPLEICIVAAIMLLLFGNKFPSRMRALGASITEFKKGLSNGESESS